jgi:predicted dehydrogenase
MSEKPGAKVKIGIIGVGYWGPNYARICYELENVELVWVADLNKEALQKIKQKYPLVKTTTDYQNILRDKTVKAVVVTTPAQVHFSIVKDALKAGKHVLVEKPLTANLEEAKGLADIVKQSKKVVLVDHIFKFNPAVNELKSLISKNKLGKIYYVSAFYTALGPIRKDVDAMWDLAPHWVYTINHLLDLSPIQVSAKGGDYLKKGMNDVVFLNLRYPRKIIANIHASWLYPQKVRSLAVVGSKKMAVFDDASADAKLTIFDRGATYNSKDPNFANLQVIMRDGDIVIPKLPKKEPLKEALVHFLDCIVNSRKPVADVNEGIEVVKILTAADLSIKTNGGAQFL